MPKVPIDFSDVQDYEALPKADYDCIIDEITYVEPQVEDKYPYLNVQLSVTEEEFQNRKLWAIWSLSPKALFRMKGDLENLGLDVDDVEIEYDEDTMIVTEPDLAGLACIVTVSQRTWEGRVQNQVDVIRSMDGAQKVGDKKSKAKSPAKKPSAKKGARKLR